MLLSAVPVLVVVLPSSEVPDGIRNYRSADYVAKKKEPNHVQDHIILTFYYGELLTPSYNPQAGEPHHVGCPQCLFNIVTAILSPCRPFPLFGISVVLCCSDMGHSEASSKVELTNEDREMKQVLMQYCQRYVTNVTKESMVNWHLDWRTYEPLTCIVFACLPFRKIGLPTKLLYFFIIPLKKGTQKKPLLTLCHLFVTP
jgi:hypothetical protein